MANEWRQANGNEQGVMGGLHISGNALWDPEPADGRLSPALDLTLRPSAELAGGSGPMRYRTCGQGGSPGAGFGWKCLNWTKCEIKCGIKSL